MESKFISVLINATDDCAILWKSVTSNIVECEVGSFIINVNLIKHSCWIVKDRKTIFVSKIRSEEFSKRIKKQLENEISYLIYITRTILNHG